MHEFHVQFRSLRDVQEFVTLASKQTQHMTIGNDNQVNATSFFGILALNCRKPQKVAVECSDEDFSVLLNVFDRFLVK